MKPRSKKMGNKNLIGNKVLKFRHDNNIKQKDFLARLQSAGLDISSTSLSRLEWQERTVSDIEIIKISEIMNTTPNKILSWTSDNN